MTPNIPEYNVAISGVVYFIAHLLSTEYTPHTHTAAVINKSPLLNPIENSTSRCPFDRTKRTPTNENNIEPTWKAFIFSFKNKNENNAMENIFKVEINPTFVAEVNSNARN